MQPQLLPFVMCASIVPAGEKPLREEALAYLYHRLPHGERDRQLAKTLDAVARNELTLENLLVAVEGQRIIGTVLAVTRPGGAAFLWPPVVQQSAAADVIARDLLQAVGRRVDQQQVGFMQCLLDPTDAWGQAVLEQGGVPRVTELILLSRSLPGDRLQSAEVELTTEHYTEAGHARFATTVEKTYTATLDCPALARIRSGDQLLESHRATGQFNPQACRIYRNAGQDVGILLLAEHPDRNVCEVAYLGVVPEARGRGIGRTILIGGIEIARATGRASLEIAVDAANSPALRLYNKLGFFELRRFAVHLRFRQDS